MTGALLMLSLLAAPQELCMSPICSNDPIALGDETLAFTPPPDSDINVYQIINMSTMSVCLTVLPPPAGEDVVVLIAGTPCLTENDTARLSARACDRSGLCGSPPPPVEFLPYLCIENGVEIPCFPGAPCRLPPERGCP